MQALTACGDDPVGPLSDPGITFPLGANVTDTARAAPVQVLRVQVYGTDGRPAARTEVRASGVIGMKDGQAAYIEITAGRLGDLDYGAAVVDTTDTNGVVHFRLRLGFVAGPARLVVTAPALGMQDTARFTIVPANATSFRVEPTDTAVAIGKSVTLRASVFDSYGNARNEPVTFRAEGSAGTLDGTVVSGTAFGRVAVIAETPGWLDTSWVSVVPSRTIAVYSRPAHTGEATTIYMLNLDGSGVTNVRESIIGTGYFGDMAVAWVSPTKLVYHDATYPHSRHLYVHDLETGSTERFLPAADRMPVEYLPRTGYDRAWVYFSGGSQTQISPLHRARPDGTGVEQITATAIVQHWGAAPSPDGTQVAYVADVDGFEELEVVDLATREKRSLNLAGTSPRWSPDGHRIAYIAAETRYLSVVKADGSGARALANSTTRFGADIDWSADGMYIVGSVDGGRLAIVDVATGDEVLVRLRPEGRQIGSPVFRP